MAIVDAVADARGVAPTDLDLVLEEHVDTDAINQLMAHEAVSCSLSFELPEHDVTVTSEGEIRVDSHSDDIVALQ